MFNIFPIKPRSNCYKPNLAFYTVGFYLEEYNKAYVNGGKNEGVEFLKKRIQTEVVTTN